MNGLEMKKEFLSSPHKKEAITSPAAQCTPMNAHSLCLTFQCVGLKELLTPYTERLGA